MSGRAALVTGAGGFVGANLVQRLAADGHRVTAVARPGGDHWRLAEADLVEIAEVDLREPADVRQLVARVRPEWIFHLAAHGAYEWQSDARVILETNVYGTLHLLEAACESGFEAFVHAGSSSEYGYKDHAPPETEALEPNSEYAVTKASSTLLCGWMARRHDARVVTLRLYSAYGPYEDPRRLIPTLLTHGLCGELPPLVGPEVARDFVSIHDVVEAFVLAATIDAGAPDAVYNVGTGVQTTIRDVVDTARRVLEVGAEPEWGTMEERRWDTDRWVADSRRIRSALGWEPRVGLEEGLGGMADWLRRSRHLWSVYGIAD